ncbi:homeotic protein female sterile-like [Anopheles cruzii]|uniref:homeotic protein female sterile-like n=1 Tax=Anopheles cruzii TaxID=68878 RepID=UPI0022EC95DD|nr:homeotic protein female sterile-like [Anopheles cruzii]
MTTATVAAQQSENLGRYPCSSSSSGGSGNSGYATTTATGTPSTQRFTMNDTQQQQPQPLHTIDNSPQHQQNTNGSSGGLSIAANLALHGGVPSNGSNSNGPGNSNINHGSSKHRSGGSLNEAKMEHHHLREQQHHQSQQQSQQQQHHQQQLQQQQQHALHSRLRGVSPTPSEQQYALKWNDFQSSILSSFRHLRDEEDFVDVTIACESRSFTAHKVVLSACSPYFRKLLKANPCEHPIVILRDVRSEDIENLLRFMYNGEVHIGQDQLSDFLKTAQLLQVRGLADGTTGGNPTGGRTSANSSMLNSSLSTPAVQELKASPTSTSLPWELPDDTNPAPPPQKRTKSSELYRKQHGLSPDDPIPLDLLPIGQHPLTRERDRSKDKSKDHHQHQHRGSSEHDLHQHHHHHHHHQQQQQQRERDRSLELRESLLGQALEGGPTLTVPSKHPDLLSLQAVASGEDSNSSDTAASDHGDDIEGLNGNVEHTRPSFPFLGLQGIPGLIPGPSGMHGDNFDARQHCDALIKEEIDDATQRSDLSPSRTSPDRRSRDHERAQNDLDYGRSGRQQQQQHLHHRRLAKRFKRHQFEHSHHAAAAEAAAAQQRSGGGGPVAAFHDESGDDRDRETERRAAGLSALDDAREALALRRRPITNHTEVPARRKPTFSDSSKLGGSNRHHHQHQHHRYDEDDPDDEDGRRGRGERRVPAHAGEQEDDDDDNMGAMRDEEDEYEDGGAASEENEVDLKVDGRLSAIATTLDSEYHKRMAAAGVLAAAAAASAVSSMNGAAALGDAGSEQAAADFFAAHHKAGTHELAFKQHFLNEKVRLQALLQRQAQQHQHHHHQKLAGFLLSTASTPPTPTLTPTSVLNLGQASGSDQRGGSQSPAASGCRPSAATVAASGVGGANASTGGGYDSGAGGNSNGSGNSKQQSSVAAVAAAAAAADRLFAAAYSSAGGGGSGSGTAAAPPSVPGSSSSNNTGGGTKGSSSSTSTGGNGTGSGQGNATGQVYLLPCPLCEVPLEPRVFRQHLDRHYPRDSPVCPVIQCGRRFAHPNSVRNHMRLKHTNQWAQMKAMRSSGGPFTGIP